MFNFYHRSESHWSELWSNLDEWVFVKSNLINVLLSLRSCVKLRRRIWTKDGTNIKTCAVDKVCYRHYLICIATPNTRYGDFVWKAHFLVARPEQHCSDQDFSQSLNDKQIKLQLSWYDLSICGISGKSGHNFQFNPVDFALWSVSMLPELQEIFLPEVFHGRFHRLAFRRS